MKKKNPTGVGEGKVRGKGNKLGLETLEVVVYQAKGRGLPFSVSYFKNKNTLKLENFFCKQTRKRLCSLGLLFKMFYSTILFPQKKKSMGKGYKQAIYRKTILNVQ